MTTAVPATPTLDLTTLDDAGFQQLYVERVQPCFAANEADRAKAVSTFRTRLFIGAPLLLILAIVAASMSGQIGWAVGILVLGGFVLYFFAYGPLDAVSKRVKQQSLSNISDAMGVNFQMGGFDPPAFQRCHQLRLLPGYTSTSFEDLFHGTFKNAGFDLYEAHLQETRGSGKNRRTVTTFRGQVIRLAFPRQFQGLTIVRRDAGVFNMLNGYPNLKKIGLVDPKFEKIFEVYGDDQVEARFLVHPAFMERLMQLETALKGQRLRCAFQQGDLLIAVEGGNLFEPGSMFQPLVDQARARKIVDDIASVMRVVDAVLTAQAQR